MIVGFLTHENVCCSFSINIKIYISDEENRTKEKCSFHSKVMEKKGTGNSIKSIINVLNSTVLFVCTQTNQYS